MPSIYVNDIYENYIRAWNNETITGYFPGYYIVPENNGRIPTIDELINSLVEEVTNK